MAAALSIQPQSCRIARIGEGRTAAFSLGEMVGMTRTTENTMQLEVDDGMESYLQYSQEFEQACRRVEEILSRCQDPQELVMELLKEAVYFYDGDWAGILDADLTTKVWSPLWWYNRKRDGMTDNKFYDLHEGEYLHRWVNSLTNGTPIRIEDIEELADASPLEYTFLRSLGVKTVLAVPFWKRPTGFMIVRNPKRHLQRTTLLKMMTSLAASAVTEKRLRDSTKFQAMAETIKGDRDVVINLFGELQIITSKGMLTEKNLNSPKNSKLIAYLLLHLRRPASPIEIVRDLWPEDDLDRAGYNVKSQIYRLQQSFGLISDFRLIESTRSGYWISPELNIITDLNMFDELWSRAQTTADDSTRGHLLKKAMELYKSGPLDIYCREHWFLPTVAHYSIRYAGVVNQLLSMLDQAGDYVCILEYANIARKNLPENADVHYWLIRAMRKLGMGEMARNELRAVKGHLTEEDYEDMVNRFIPETR